MLIDYNLQMGRFPKALPRRVGVQRIVRTMRENRTIADQASPILAFESDRQV